MAEGDVEAPKLISYSIEDGDYTAGDSVPVEMVVEDDTITGVYVDVYMRKPISGGLQWIRMWALEGGVYRGELLIKEGMESGRYEFDYVYLADTWNNSRVVRGTDIELNGFNVNGTEADTVAPKLISYSIEDGDYTAGDSVPVEMVVEDDTITGVYVDV
ncbi:MULTISPECIES: hypothetical protein, partial [unclassified Exiguobacterium]|uniref:hypothetical protein n=1 Tax=unclassified Exiguobacterium TaxID=2644629 RepID=UPI001BE6B227